MGTSATKLHIYEEILLLALREEDGKLESKACFEAEHLISAALLVELAFLERISISEDKKALVHVSSTAPLNSVLLDEALEKIAATKKERSLSYWITALQSVSGFMDKAAEGLCAKRILAAKESKIFFFFDKTYYPELDPRPEQSLVLRLEKAIFTDTTEVDDQTIMLLAILYKSDILKVPFDAKALKARKQRLEALCKGDIVGKAARKAVQSAHTAIMIATMTPAITVTTVT